MNDFKSFVDNCLDKKSRFHAYIVGFINEQIVRILKEYNIEIATKEIYLTQKGLTRSCNLQASSIIFDLGEVKITNVFLLLTFYRIFDKITI